MSLNIEEQRIRGFRLFSQLAGILVAVCGSVILLGWTFDMPVLKLAWPGLVVMKVNSALGFIFAGVSLWLFSRSASKRGIFSLEWLCAFLVTLLGLLTLNEIIFNLNFGIDKLFFEVPPTAMDSTFRRGQMAPMTALNFILIGSALLFITTTSHQVGQKIVPWFTYPVLGIAFITILGYIYHAEILYHPSNVLIAMALPTTVLFLLLSVGILCQFPQAALVGMFTSESIGGHLARRLIPALIVTTIFFDWLLEQAVKHKLISHLFDKTYLAVLIIMVMVILIRQIAKSLDRIEAQRREGMGRLVQEIAERTRTEEALRDSEERYRFLVANLPNTTVLLFNKELQLLLAVGEEITQNYSDPVSQIEGKTLSEALPAELADFLAPLCRQALLGEATRFDMPYRNKYYANHVLPVRNAKGEIYLGMVVSRNITERQQAEQALRQAKKAAEQANIALGRFKATLDMTLDAVFMLDADFKIIYANQGAIKHVGYSQAELLQITVLDIRPDFTEASFRETVMPLLEEKKSVQIYETWHKHKNGHLVPVEVFLQYISMPDQTNCFVKIVRDITERKQIEATLQEAKDKAEAANRAKSVFLANMSHELRTPLNGILGFTQILSCDNSLNHEQLERIAIIQRSGEYLLTLINDILDLSKIEANRLELEPSNFYFDSFLSGITELFELRAKQKGIAFYCERVTSLPRVIYADEKRLRQVLINLLGNAMKFTEQGGVCLKIGYDDQRRLRFQVEDTGIGIVPEELDKIFLPFQQTGDKHYRAQGTGLGLTITKTLVEMMAGEIQVESTFQVGSKFWITLDLPEVTERIKIEAPIEKPTIIGYQMTSLERRGGEDGKIKVLVVDDHWENRAVVTQLLTPLGFVLAEVTNGREAIEKAQEWHPQVILMDLVMPVMDGFTATRHLRKIPAMKEVLIVALSASTFEVHHQESTEAGCNDFVAKPFRVETLLECLQKHLHLTWIYAPPKQVAMPRLKTQVQVPQQESVVVPPSTAQLTMLSTLAKKGDIKGILDYMEDLEKLDTKLVPFTTHIRQLAKSFQRKKIFEFVKQYLV